MKNKGTYQKKVSSKFLVKHGKMIDEKGKPTGNPVMSVSPSKQELDMALAALATHTVRTPEEQDIHDAALGIVQPDVVEVVDDNEPV